MKKIILYSIIFAAFIITLNGSYANAQSYPQSDSERQYLIRTIMAQIATLKTFLESTNKNLKTGESSITVLEPTSFTNIKYGDPYILKWAAKNIPPSSMLVTDTNAAILHGGSGISGGTHQEMLPTGSHNGTRKIDTGIGYSDPGVYDLQLMVIACADVLCEEPIITYDQVTGKRIYLTKILAKSNIARFNISENEDIQQKNSGDTRIGEVFINTKDMTLGKEVKISYSIEGDVVSGQEACITLVSSSGGHFSLNSDTYDTCAVVKSGLNTRTWTPFRTPGFKLNPGIYKINITLPDKPDGSGKDVGNIAEKNSSWFELLPETY